MSDYEGMQTLEHRENDAAADADLAAEGACPHLSWEETSTGARGRCTDCGTWLGDEEHPAEPTCPHPPSARRLAEVTGGQVQVCTACGEEVPGAAQQIIPRERPGSADPSHREGTDRSRGGLRHITWDPQNPAASRPYTPEEVELELADTLDRIERGAGFWTTQEEKRSAAKHAYELAYARARFRSTGRSADQRHDEAFIACAELHEEWQLLELTCRTAKEGLHNLRSKQSGLQSILRSALDASRGGGFR